MSSTLTTSAGMMSTSADSFVSIVASLCHCCSPSLKLILSNIFSGKDKKRVDKTVAEEKTSTASESSVPSGTVTPDMLRAALEQVRQEEPPSSTEEKEAYFMTQVGMGEQLAAQGMCNLQSI